MFAFALPALCRRGAGGCRWPARIDGRAATKEAAPAAAVVEGRGEGGGAARDGHALAQSPEERLEMASAI